MARLACRVPVGMAVNDSNTASLFGSRIAEAPILERMREDAALGRPADYGLYADKGNNDSDPEMFVFIGLLNKLPTERLSAMRSYRASLPAGQWSRPDALCHTKAAREYYEIKPESASSIDGGQRKFPNIDRFITRFQLPYHRGNSYMNGGGTDEAPLLDSNAAAPPGFPLQEFAVLVVKLGIQVAGMIATLAALAAVAAYSATGVAATAGAGATTGAGAGTQVQVRVAADAFREGVTRIATADTVEMFDLGVQECTEAAPRELMRAVGR